MKIAAKDLILFKKLRIKSVLDLALILPKKLENLSFSSELKENEPFTGEIIIQALNSRNGKLFGTCFCESLNTHLSFVFFNPSKWHYSVFKIGSRLLITAKLSLYNGVFQLNNPKIIKKAGIFIPKYQISGIKDESIEALIQNYIDFSNLLATGLDERLCHLLLAFHANNAKSYEMMQNMRAYIKDLKFIEIYNFLKRLRAKKIILKALYIELFDIKDWLKSLPFSPTKDQLNAIADIRSDLVKSEAKRRVIMGDVGCGKTLVLLAAALSVYPKQALLMAPTSILASQLFDEAKKLLPSFMRLCFVKGGKKDKNLEEELKNANLIIGTHALIHQKGFEAVLVMIDEQHRFGSNQRQKISELSSKDELNPHFVQFSATPIPRTLSMIQSELVSFSFIKQMPFKKDIQSLCVQDKDFNLLKAKIDSELAKNNQIAIIYPLVNESENSPDQSIEMAQAFWQKYYQNVFITHGKDKNKDEILKEFKEKGQILLATTVIEVGISLPRLSTIIIVGAEKLGLATLHQLRGRVGRVGLKSYCYLYTKLKEIPARLLEFCQSLDGFKIAELDLKNRQSGDLLDGLLQHGNEFKFFDFSQDELILEAAKARLDALNENG